VIIIIYHPQHPENDVLKIFLTHYRGKILFDILLFLHAYLYIRKKPLSKLFSNSFLRIIKLISSILLTRKLIDNVNNNFVLIFTIFYFKVFIHEKDDRMIGEIKETKHK
jgi:hypothetical protein